MTCRFDLDHYRELLGSIGAGGYEIAFFDHEPRAGEVLLRHDVDLSLGAAVAMAELEAEVGVASTYLVMTRSEFYNLDSPSGEHAVERLRELGHSVGLHALWPRDSFDGRFDRVFTWHNPEPRFIGAPLDGAVNAMTSPWVDVYRSDSNQNWRHGCPHEEFAAGRFERLQLLIHPEIWVHAGRTMRETMLAMLDAERQRRLAQLAADRIDLS